MKTIKKTFALSLLSLLLVGCQSNQSSNNPTSTSSSSQSSSQETTSSSLPDSSSSPAGDSSSSSTDSSVEPVIVPDYFLAGNIDLGEENERKFEYDETAGTYSLKGITLRRGDSFIVTCSDASVVVEFKDMLTDSLMQEGKNNYVNVLAEGIFDFNISAEGIVSVLKTGSSYESVRLVYADDSTEALSFTMNEDFTYSLKDANIRYRQAFYIALDDERLDFDDMDYTDSFYEACRYQEDMIRMIRKGTFDLTIDFDQIHPLVVTSDDIQTPNTLPTNADEYRAFMDKVEDDFADFGTSYVATKKVTNHSSKSVAENDYTETLATNEHYIKEENFSYASDATEEAIATAKEGAGIRERSALYNDTNYYSMSIYSGASASTAPSLSGAIINDEQKEETTAEEGETEESTIVNKERDFVTTEQAKKNVASLSGEAGTLDRILNYFVSSSHVTSSSLSQNQIDANLEITGGYIDSIGDRLQLKATNREVYKPYYGTNYYVLNELDIVVGEDGHIEEGTYTRKTHSGSSIFVTDDSNYTPVDNIDEYLTETEVYTFEIGYEDRSEVTEYKLDPAKYVATEIDVASSTKEITSLSTVTASDLGIMVVEPISAIDLSNYEIMSYDSAFFSENYSGDLAGTGKIGTTTVTLGNTYNYVTKDVTVTTTYEEMKYSSSLGSFRIGENTLSSSTILYVGQSYDVVLNTSTGYDPAVTIETNNTEAVTITNLTTTDEMRANGKASFTLTINSAVSDVTLKATSISQPSMSVSTSLTLSEPWSASKISGIYGRSSSSSWGTAIKSLTLNADNTGSIVLTTDEEGTSHSFTYNITEDGYITLNESSDVTALDITVRQPESRSASNGEAYQRNRLYCTAVTVNGSSCNMTTIYSLNPFFTTDWNIVDEEGTSYSIVRFDQSTCMAGDIYFTDGTTTSKFTFTESSSSYSVSKYDPDVDATGSTYSGSLSYSDNVYTIRFSSAGKVFTFTRPTAE